MRIGVDIMGGDFAPQTTVLGSFLARDQIPEDVELVLIGDRESIIRISEDNGFNVNRVSIVHTTESIVMSDHPYKAFMTKADSSIVKGFKMLKDGEIDAFCSAGNTGAMLVGALFSIKALEGVIRPTISSIIPKANGTTGLLLDVGLNADCKPEQLNQFAIMGSVYAELVLGIANPTTGLINLGEEEGKGNLLTQATYPLLKSNQQIRFIGNIEGRDILQSKADVMICDGFTGNIILKLAESLYEISQERKVKDDFFDRFNFENYGGTPVLGVAKPVIIGHGISGAKAFMNMIHLAQIMIEKDVMQKMKAALA